MIELKNFILSALSPKIDELRGSLLQKINSQEEQLTNRLKKIEIDEEKQFSNAKNLKKKK
jgi:hypothetical protein